MKRLLCAALLVFPCALMAEAPRQVREISPWRPWVMEKAGPSCDGGLRYDDGTLEDAYSPGGFSGVAQMAMRFDLPTDRSSLSAVCICWAGLDLDFPLDLTVDASVVVWDVATNGTPGTILASQDGLFTTNAAGTFFRVEFPAGTEIPKSVFVGGEWLALLEDGVFFICADETGATSQPAFERDALSGAPWAAMGNASNFPQYRNLGIRIEATPLLDPDPPAGSWLTTTALPDFRFKVRITSGATQRIGTQVVDCVPETLCVAGAIPDRSEVFLRVIGPRSNGYLWPQVVRFTVAQVEVWVEQTSSGAIQYYKLPAVPSDGTELPGLVDKEGFLP